MLLIDGTVDEAPVVRECPDILRSVYMLRGVYSVYINTYTHKRVTRFSVRLWSDKTVDPLKIRSLKFLGGTCRSLRFQELGS